VLQCSPKRGARHAAAAAVLPADSPCRAIAAVGAMESKLAIDNPNLPIGSIQLSVQQLVSLLLFDSLLPPDCCPCCWLVRGRGGSGGSHSNGDGHGGSRAGEAAAESARAVLGAMPGAAVPAVPPNAEEATCMSKDGSQQCGYHTCCPALPAPPRPLQPGQPHSTPHPRWLPCCSWTVCPAGAVAQAAS